MNKTISVALATFFLTTSGVVIAAPQRGKGPGAKGQARGSRRMGMSPAMLTQKLAKQLALTEEQKTQLKAILTQSAKEIQAIQKDTTLSAADKKTKLKANHKATDEKIKAILTPEQQTKLDTTKTSPSEDLETPPTAPAEPEKPQGEKP